MRVLHPENKTLYIGDENRALLFVEITPPETIDDWNFIRQQIDFFLNHEKSKTGMKKQTEEKVSGENQQ